MLNEGHIELIFGPMFSGKSSEMMRKVRRYEHASKKCLVINYLHDNRYSNDEVMSTHDKITMRALKTADLSKVKSKAMEYQVVAIDEGQFFPDIVQFCQELANSGIIVIIAALDGTFQRKVFGNIMNLVPLAEKVMKLSAVCVTCCNEAAFTQRTIESKQIELIGGAEMYKPVCRKCFMKNQTSVGSKEKEEEKKISSVSTLSEIDQNLSKLSIEQSKLIA